MKINLKSTNLELTVGIRNYIQDKLGGLDKYFSNIQQVDVEVGLTRKGQQKGNIYFCEVNLAVPRQLLRVRKECMDLNKAVNEVRKGIQREIMKYKETCNI